MSFKQLKKNIFILIIACCVSALGTASAAGLVARLDRTQVVEGDPVVLTLATAGDSSGTPDLSALQQDFDLLSQGQSNRMSFINGRSSSSREWHLTLMPRHSGTVTIPAIPFAGGNSNPLTLEVLPASQAAQQGITRPVMVEAEVEPESPYVQQKLIYTVRLLYGVPLRDANLSEPRVKDALVYPVGDERRFETYRGGRQFQAIERRYAILPQRSGTLTIGGPVLSARIPEAGQQRGNGLRDRLSGGDPFAGLGGMFGQTRPIQARAADKTLEVRAQPAGTASPWLPAESLTLNEAWSPDPPTFRVGEPTTRTIVITARGLADEQLPEPQLESGNGINVYPDKAHAETRPDKDTLIARKVVTTAIVPTRSGQLTLPEVSVTWWDIAAGKAVVARVPVREVNVLPAVNVGSDSTPQAGAAAPAAPPAADRNDRMDQQTAASPASGSAAAAYWPWIVGLLAVSCIALLMLWLWLRPRTRRTAMGQVAQTARATEPVPPRPSARQVMLALQQAFRNNDTRAARKALLEWAAVRWPEDSPRGLDALAQRLAPEASAVMTAIDSRLYAASPAPWDGDAAWRVLKPVLENAAKEPATDDESAQLPPLYPRTQ